MNRFFAAFVLFALLAVGVSATRASAAVAEQNFFAGTWRCQGQTMNIAHALGPWYMWRATAGSSTSQSYVYHNGGGGWVWQGVNSAGAYWTLTSNGWQGNVLTFNGTYTDSSAQSQRRIITRNSDKAFTIQTWRNGSMVTQMGCNR